MVQGGGDEEDVDTGLSEGERGEKRQMERQRKRLKQRHAKEDAVVGEPEAEEEQVAQKVEGAEGRQEAEARRVKRAPANLMRAVKI